MARADAEPELAGMGTTLCALALIAGADNDRLAIANVGDSRIYVHANGELHQLTEDHSLVAQLVRDGTLTASEAETHPQRNVLTRALGIDPHVAVDAWELQPSAGDRFVLCSDGLSNELTDDQIAAVLRRLSDPQEAADRNEVQVGRDVQFIRINGTLVGGLAGLTIYTVSQLLL